MNFRLLLNDYQGFGDRFVVDQQDDSLGVIRGWTHIFSTLMK